MWAYPSVALVSGLCPGLALPPREWADPKEVLPLVRVNVDIPGISKLKWTGMGEFNSDDHYIYYCGQDSLEEME